MTKWLSRWKYFDFGYSWRSFGGFRIETQASELVYTRFNGGDSFEDKGFRFMATSTMHHGRKQRLCAQTCLCYDRILVGIGLAIIH